MEKVTHIINSLEKIAQEQPNQVVFQDVNHHYTYADLQEKSNHVAAYIDAHIAEGPIVVYGGQEFEMIASFVGCTKAGRAYIPIEKSTPFERFQLICSVAHPAAIIFTEEALPKEELEQLGEIPTLLYKDIPTADYTISHPVEGEDTYYIIFTSGTTGVPKGVQISHDNLVSFVNWELSEDFAIGEGKRFLSQAPYSFDLSVMSVYPALLSGGSLAPLTKEVINDFKTLFEVLPKLEVNVWVSTPSFMDICLMDPNFNGENLPTLTHFLFCGEELPKATAQKLVDRFPQAHIFNTYGPTETTVAISQIEITQEVIDASDRLPIGYVKEDTHVYILDENTPVAAGEVGEIVIAGPSVSKGYMNNKEKTEEVFFTYEDQPAYRTGDAGHMEDDGLLRYDGRMDFQVKLHGYRMELEDIDHHLNEVSYVKQAVVVPKYKDHKVQQLVAYVIVEENPFEKSFQLTKAIKEEMQETVMEYMIPQRFVYVEQLPLTQNGKIDRKGLINEVNNT